MTLGPSWETHTLPLASFDRQLRGPEKHSDWERVPFEPPGSVQELVFKLGYFIHEAGAHGRAFVDDLVLE